MRLPSSKQKSDKGHAQLLGCIRKLLLEIETWFWAESVPVSRRRGGPLVVEGEDMAPGRSAVGGCFVSVPSFW